MTPRTVRIATQSLGLALIGGGCWWIYPPACLIVLGTILFGAAVHATLRSNK